MNKSISMSMWLMLVLIFLELYGMPNTYLGNSITFSLFILSSLFILTGVREK